MTILILRSAASGGGGGSGNTITINGSGFGTKSAPAPYFFQPFTNLANGATPTDAGFDTWVNRGGEAVTLADGVGGGSLRCDPGAANNAFPHIGKYLPSNVTELRCSFLAKLYGASSVGRQLKFCRSGDSRTGDGVADYGTSNANFSPSLFLDQNGILGANSILCQWRNPLVSALYPEDSGQGSSGIPQNQQPSETDFTSWVQCEVYYKFNDIGQTNGGLQISTNGFMWHNRLGGTQRSSSSEYIQFIQPIPSLDLDGSPTDFDYAISRVVIDTGSQCRAHAFLSSSSTYAGVGANKYEIEATSWSATQVVGNKRGTIPIGYNYAYVVKDDGTVANSSGLSYTVS